MIQLSDLLADGCQEKTIVRNSVAVRTIICVVQDRHLAVSASPGKLRVARSSTVHERGLLELAFHEGQHQPIPSSSKILLGRCGGLFDAVQIGFRHTGAHQSKEVCNSVSELIVLAKKRERC